jgi:hypothetical protein
LTSASAGFFSSVPGVSGSSGSSSAAAWKVAKRCLTFRILFGFPEQRRMAARDCGCILAAKATACASRNSWHHAWTPRQHRDTSPLACHFKPTAKSVHPTEAPARSSTTPRRTSPRQSSAPKGGSARLQIYRGRLPVRPDLRVEVDLLTLIEPESPARSTVEMWTNTSGPPLEGAMNPDGRFWRAERCSPNVY